MFGTVYYTWTTRFSALFIIHGLSRFSALFIIHGLTIFGTVYYTWTI